MSILTSCHTTMPRYFYLLCLLISIDWTFCYEYISDRNAQNKHGRRLSKTVRNQKSRQGDKDYVHKKRQKYEMVDDKDPLAQIDVASFIQKPDEYAVDENSSYEINDRRKTKLKHENEYGSLLEYNPDEYGIQRRNSRPYYLNPSPDNSFDFGPDPLLLKDTIHSRHLNLDSLSLHGLNNGKVARNSENKPPYGNYMPETYDANSNRIHNPEKKCILKYMKFPFFSHNKTETQKLKKAKKRKVIRFNCSNKEKKSENLPASDFFKKTATQESLETLSKIAMDVPSDSLESQQNEIVRGKRDEWAIANDRERQLKELDEIQRKVDDVEISSAYQKKT